MSESHRRNVSSSITSRPVPWRGVCDKRERTVRSVLNGQSVLFYHNHSQWCRLHDYLRIVPYFFLVFPRNDDVVGVTNSISAAPLVYYIASDRWMGLRVQRSAVTVTPSGIGKSVTIADCHSKSVTLIVLNELGIAKTVPVADCHSNRCHSNRRPLYWAIAY